jgi:bifunctional non-homologous end joining protein LigD
MALREYRKKRHFSVTSEPAGKQVKAKAKSKRLSYVIQKHDATRLHYDFRLELDGVLKSWAVPKGPALDPQEKRLAVEVEDHPLEYAKFEGHIPEGEYGAGEVIVWDRGRWEPEGDPHEGLRKGKLEFTLAGEKLSGAWVLLRIKGRREGDRSNKNNWLLIKRHDDAAQPLSKFDITESQPQSVKSGKVLGQPAPKKRATQKKAAKKAKTKRAAARKREVKSRAAKKAKLPADVEVQLATLTDKPPPGDDWVHEVKFDGYRMLCYIDGDKVKLVTRNQQDWTHRYPAVVDAAQALDVQQAILDGEVVAMLPTGVTSFQALQNAAKGAGEAKLAYYAFDLLYLDGYDLRRMPLVERKQLLEELVTEAGQPALLYSEHFDSDAATLLRECCKMGLEGIITKRASRPYLAGRSEDWLKLKCLGREELVIGGYTLSTAMQRGIGALLVGYFDGDEFVYAGRVGTGFSHALLVEMRERLSKIEQRENPFRDVPAKERGKHVRWVKPQLVAEIEFTGWTDAGVLRHPSFQGLREDKPASAVTRPASLKLAAEGAEGGRGGGAKGRQEAMAKKKSAKKKSAKSIKAAVDEPELPGDLHVRLTNPDRVLYPETGLTKLGLATYYAQVGKWMLPYVLDRPLSLVRCPAGMAAKCFYQKHAGTGTPDALGRVKIKEKDEVEEYVYIHDLEGLVSLAQMSILEIHPWGSRRDQLEKPDYLIFDLDPDPGVAWKRVVEGAIAVRDALAKLDLTSFVKTTGGKGLHIVMPLAPRRYEWDECKDFARRVAEGMVAAAPALYTANMSKAQRKNKIFIDYFRNGRGATAVAPYSTRAKPGATVSVPIAWDELSNSLTSDHFHTGNVVRRLQSLESDPWADFFDVKQGLPKKGARS